MDLPVTNKSHARVHHDRIEKLAPLCDYLIDGGSDAQRGPVRPV